MDLEQALARINDLEGKLNQSTATIGDLRKQLGGFEGIDPAQYGELKTKAAQVDQLITERDNLAKQNQELATAKGQASLQLEAVQAATRAGVIPDYMPVILPQITNALKFGDDGNVLATDGKTPEQYAASLRERYPAVFAPVSNAVGTGQNDNGQQTSPVIPVVSLGDSRVVMGVEPSAVLDGKVAIAE